MNGSSPESVARALQESCARLGADLGLEAGSLSSSTPWEERPEQERHLLTSAIAELLERGVVAQGAPDEEEDGQWEREVWTGKTDLPRRFYDEGMLWLTNRVLHPFGWSLGVVVENLEGAVTGLVLSSTKDPEGIITPASTEIAARRKFFAAQRARRDPLPPPPSDEVMSEGPSAAEVTCEACGFTKWFRDERSGCPNPRCRLHVPVPRD